MTVSQSKLPRSIRFSVTHLDAGRRERFT